jgi:tetratricopeptide (TPR) repeat protein
MKRALATAAIAFAGLSGCAASMHEPPPVAALAPGTSSGKSPDDLVHAGDAAWARRGEAGQALAAQNAYLDAAAADERRVDALLGALQAMHYRLEHEAGVNKGELSQKAVQVGQWCLRRAPQSAACKYRLAIALGQEAREHPSQGKDAVNHMLDLLHQAIAADPKLDSAGPHRVLALLLLRAPEWPTGPGDPEQGLEEARAAVAVVPDAPENQLALGEALEKNGNAAEAHAAYQKAAELAGTARAPEAAGWLADARAGLAKTKDH